jgi:hypothetical protein
LERILLICDLRHATFTQIGDILIQIVQFPHLLQQWIQRIRPALLDDWQSQTGF